LVPPDGISAKATGNGGLGDPVAIRGNLDSAAKAPDITINPFAITDPSSYNYTTSATVYDSLGNDHSLSMFFVKQDPTTAPNEWDVYVTFDGAALAAPDTPAGTLASRIGFNSSTGSFDTTLSICRSGNYPGWVPSGRDCKRFSEFERYCSRSLYKW